MNLLEDFTENGDAPLAFVIFGVTGDLTIRKLVPALYELKKSGRLNMPFSIIGFARRDWTDEKLRETFHEGVSQFSRTKPVDNGVLDDLLTSVFYNRSTFEDQSGYEHLKALLEEKGICNVVYYLATPPDEYIPIIRNLGVSGINLRECGWTRIVVEKPYGEDLASAMNLESEIHQVFKEPQIYRIDHYLGKETVQNILVLRFANGIFEPLWNRNYVDHVQILVSESLGVGTRAGYYETAGVVRDIFQNHMMQLLALTAMEAPLAFNAEAVRNEKVKVLSAIKPFSGEKAMFNTFRAQYVSGVIDSTRVPGYKDEAGVSPSSTTETLLAARMYIDNWRWAGVPFYVLSGKRLPKRLTQIAIHFKQTPLSLFNWQNMAGDAPNILVLDLQPNEAITLTFGVKKPGPINQISPASMDFRYQEAFEGEPPEAYERLLLDCINGDATLFTRSDEVLAQWGLTDKILAGWAENQVKNLPVYEAGTWGPEGLAEFIEKDGRKWRLPE